MANIDIGWEIEGGQISPEESVRAMLDVIPTKDIRQSGSFWTWDNKASYTPYVLLTYHYYYNTFTRLLPDPSRFYLYLMYSADICLGASILAVPLYRLIRII